MINMEELELTSFQIISSVGTARSMYVEAIHLAKNGKFDEAKERISEGQKIFAQGHHFHTELVQKEAQGDSIPFQLLLMHAEDQLMSAEAFGILADEFIDVYKKINEQSN